MRVCLISNQIAAWGKIGGFGSNARRLARGLIDAGIDVHAVVPRRSGQARREELDGMTIWGQSTPEVLLGRTLFREVGADIYHVMEPNLAGYWAQRAMPDRVHLVTSMDPRDANDWRIETAHATWSRRAKYPLQRFYEDGFLVRRSVTRAHGVYVEAEFLRDKTRRLYGLDRNPGFLPKPLDIPEGPFDKATSPVCLFLGRLDPRKNPELFFQLAAHRPDIEFVAVGTAHDRGYQAHLERRYGRIPNLELAGFVDPFRGDRFGRILSRAWLLVHPAFREGLPTAFQEASVHEMGVLATVDPGGYVGRFGHVVEREGDVSAFSRGLDAMLASSEWRQRARAGREYNVRNHALHVSVARHLEVYQNQLASRR